MSFFFNRSSSPQMRCHLCRTWCSTWRGHTEPQTSACGNAAVNTIMDPVNCMPGRQCYFIELICWWNKGMTFCEWCIQIHVHCCEGNFKIFLVVKSELWCQRHVQCQQCAQGHEESTDCPRNWSSKKVVSTCIAHRHDSICPLRKSAHMTQFSAFNDRI